MAERMILVREQGQTEYDIMYLPEVIQERDGSQRYLTLEDLNDAIQQTFSRNEPVQKITLDDITIRNINGIKYMFKKPEPKLEVTFEGLAGGGQHGGSGRESSYNFQAPVVPVSVAPSNYSSSPATSSANKDNKWLTVLEKNPFSFGHSGTTINEHLFVFGGFADEQTTNHCLLLSDTISGGGKFSKLRVRGDIPAIRERHSATLIGKKIYVFGGYCRGAELYYNNLYVFETETLNWSKLEPRGNPPDRRCGHSASVVDGKIWVFGGRVKAKKGGLFDSEGSGVMYKNDLHCYDPVTNEWFRYEPRGIGPSGRALHAATVVGRKIYIFGGANSTGFRNDTSGFCDLYELDIDNMCWTECETHNTPPSPCYGHSATYIGDDKIMYFGGKGYQVLNDIHILELKTMEWKQFAYAGNPLVPRWGHSATMHDSRVLIFGGRASHGYYNSIDFIDTRSELIELKPEEQAKEKVKRKVEEKNKTREAIGNLQNTVSELQSMIEVLGEQLLTQKKLISETRGAMVSLKKENEELRQQLIDLGAPDTRKIEKAMPPPSKPVVQQTKPPEPSQRISEPSLPQQSYPPQHQPRISGTIPNPSSFPFPSGIRSEGPASNPIPSGIRSEEPSANPRPTSGQPGPFSFPFPSGISSAPPSRLYSNDSEEPSDIRIRPPSNPPFSSLPFTRPPNPSQPQYEQDTDTTHY